MEKKCKVTPLKTNKINLTPSLLEKIPSSRRVKYFEPFLPRYPRKKSF